MPLCSPLPSPFRLRFGVGGGARKALGKGGRSKGLSRERLLKFLSVSVSARGLLLLYRCHGFMQRLYSQELMEYLT